MVLFCVLRTHRHYFFAEEDLLVLETETGTLNISSNESTLDSKAGVLELVFDIVEVASDVVG